MQKRRGRPIRNRAVEDHVLHSGHGPNVIFLPYLAQRDTSGRAGVDVEQLRSSDHDRLRLLTRESIPQQRLVKSRGAIVTAGLPLNLGDLGIVPVMIECRCHELRDRLSLGAVKAWIGHEPSTPSEPHQAKRAEVGHSDGTRRFSVGAQLSVIGREKVFSVRDETLAWRLECRSAARPHVRFVA